MRKNLILVLAVAAIAGCATTKTTTQSVTPPAVVGGRSTTNVVTTTTSTIDTAFGDLIHAVTPPLAEAIVSGVESVISSGVSAAKTAIGNAVTPTPAP